MATDLLDEMLAFTEALLREPDAPTRPFELPRPSRHLPSPRVSAPKPAARRRRSLLVAPVLIYALVALPTIAPTIRVRVDGRRVEVHARPVGLIVMLRRAGIEPVDGVLLAAVTHREIDRHFDRARVERNGRPASWSTAVHSGDRVALRNGRPSVETTEHRSVPVPGAGLPEVEYQLWNPPRAGATDQLVGVRSGEVVADTPVTAAVAATPVREPVVALTFDDGPNPASTPAILTILHNAGIKATFCVVGYAARRYPELVKAIGDEGHVLCDHTMHHVQLLGRKSADVIRAEIGDDADAIEQASGQRPMFFRAPGGTWASTLVDEVHRQGLRALGWNVDPADYTRPGAAVIANRIMGQVRPGAVILMHDGGGDRSQTVAQLVGLIERLRAAGYSFRVPLAS